MSISYQKIKGTAEPLPMDILVHSMEQGERITKGGIIMPDDTSLDVTDQQAKAAHGVRPRWCLVYKVGDQVTDVKEGDWIFVEHGRWTYAIDFIDETQYEIKIQKVDPEAIIAVSDTPPYEA